MGKKHIFLVGRFVFLVLFLSLWGFAFIPSPQDAFAQQKQIVIKYVHHMPEGQPGALQARFFEKCVKEKSNGNVVVEIYPAGQLFTARDAFPAVRKGAVDMASVVSPQMQGMIPLMEIWELPSLFQTFDQVKGAWYGYPGEIFKEYFEKNGVKLMTPGYYGFTEVSNSKREIRSPKDFKGLKIRTSGPLGADIVTLMGGGTVVLSGDEQYLAMARKTVDGTMTGLSTMTSRKFWEVQKYVILVHVGYIDIPMLINLQFWKSLPKEVQNLLQECAKESEEFVWKEAQKQESEAVGILKENGMKVYTPTPSEMEEFRKALFPLKENWIKKHGEVAEKMVKFVESIK